MSSLEVRQLAPQEWRIFRELRLRALRDAPEAFGTTAAEAQSWGPDQWRQRLGTRVAFVALDGEATIGLACGIPAERPDEAELISMWVDPTSRRQGAGRRLVDAVAGWAASEGFRTLRLWVARRNPDAASFYSSLSFARTGEVQPMGARQPGRLEFAMSRELSGVS